MYVQIVSDFIFLMYLLYCLPAYILILDFLYMLPISPNFNGCVMPKSVSALLSLYTINFSFSVSKTERNIVVSLCPSVMSACLPKAPGGFCHLNSIFPWYVTYKSFLEFIYRISIHDFDWSNGNDKVLKILKIFVSGLIIVNRLLNFLGEVQELWIWYIWNKNVK